MVNARVKVTQKRKPGRPATGRDPTTSIRFPADLIVRIEAWGAPKGIGRSAAIRRLVEQALEGIRPKAPRHAASDKSASDMAGHEIDKLADVGATNEEQASRKRRLLKGPKEFREMRANKASKGKRS